MADNKQLMFLRGLQSAINTMTSSIDGAFYLTEDSNRLYIGAGEGKAPIALNRDIGIVNSVQDLPSAPPAADKDFYYCRTENVLAFYDGNTRQWAQVNPNSDTDTVVTGVSFGNGTISADKKSVIYEAVINTKTINKLNNKETLNDPITVPNAFTIKASDLSVILPESAKVYIKEEYDIGNKELSLFADGDGAGEDENGNPLNTVVFKEGKNVAFDYDTADHKLTINANDTTYSLNVDENTQSIQLYNNDTEQSQTVAFDVAVDGGLDLDVDASTKKFTFSHSDTSDQESVELKNTGIATNTFKVFDSIKVDDFGHITELTTQDITITDTNTYIDPEATYKKDDWVVTLVDNNKGEIDIDFSEDAAALEQALVEKIEGELAKANTALTYKGTVEYADVLLGLEDVEIGDTYLVAKEFTLNDVEYKIGDLVIAHTEGEVEDGVILDEVDWTRVPSGDEMMVDTHFTGKLKISSDVRGPVTFEVQQVGVNNADNTRVGDALELAPGKDIDFTHPESNEFRTVINHATIETEDISEQDADFATTVTALTGLTIDNGHVKEIKTKTFNLRTYDLVGDDNKLILHHDSGNSEDVIAVSGDDWINVSINSDEFTIEHNAPQTAETVVGESSDTTVALTHESTFSAITEVQYDATGHVVHVGTTEFSLPEDNDTTYSAHVIHGKDIVDATDEEDYVSNPSIGIEDSHGALSSVQLNSVSDNIVIKGGAGVVSFGMVWGTF